MLDAAETITGRRVAVSRAQPHTLSARPKGVCVMLIEHCPATQIVQYGGATVREIPSDARRRIRRRGSHPVPHDTAVR
ncbi:hypothetical protein N5P37_005001 [Trichoderma harzianum]|nr:hypothetical protein N5P37_005001 [Trichoderma harzianum]